MSVFDQKGMGSYPNREFSEEIRTAMSPTEVMTVWARFDEELNVYGNILIFYWANNYFDINMLDNAL